MFARLTERGNNNELQKTQEVLTRWELAVGDGNRLIVSPLSRRVTYQDLLDVIAQIDTDELACFDSLCFDYSLVEELPGPWGIHFAVFIDLAQRLPIPMTVAGLKGQPAAAAELFRHSPAIAALCLARSGLGGITVGQLTMRRVA